MECCFPPGPTWTLEESAWDKTRVFHGSVSESKRREVHDQDKDLWRIWGQVKAATESSKVFPQLQFTNESRSEVQLKMSLLMLLLLSVQLLPCSIHAFILSCMCVYFCHCSKLLLFFLSAVHLSSVARPKPIFASSWWQRGGDCQGGWPCLLGKRRYRDLHKALAALWGQIRRSCRVVWFLWVYRMCVMQKWFQKHPFNVTFAVRFSLCPSLSCLPANVINKSAFFFFFFVRFIYLF